MINLSDLTTETRNEETMNLDELSTAEILKIMNSEDQKVAQRVGKVLPDITQAVEQIILSFNKKGRLFYIGAGTSGRLGVLDAAECVPTFGINPKMVQGLIAGGMKAMTIAVEGAEDSLELGARDLQSQNLTNKDIVVGIAASGRTPYVIGGLDYAKKVGAATISLACNDHAKISKHADINIEIAVGPEILTGSTRLKSGTAQKLVLNMLSTASMVGIGKVYKNLMVDVKPTNAKLVERSKHIIMEATDVSYTVANDMFEKAGKDVKLAIVMILTNVDLNEAKKRLQVAKGFVRKTI
ncbi:N-acetylmuramic acid 6-phosphate etherase [Pediococcus pentosaceus]|jgi:N-acetylmuramic acid 6-phosphate etherase|uniref:N-acetylmuramic acid 6-phosphate etherase n=1 Tax=Pediococcus pentosaceus CGMCC 7049 TaxID=1460385 RepID=A0AAU7NJ40_PEDPE|nr:N-acetylmuramic acid 6-phosphate etherase [Pediococcus pentosaceus]KRN49135.1 N-acetylmuramic acid-6-phosphate etherase [Pediococcus pentosaceus]MCE5960505.1 N-acetylmuramic acid 6-phosphate etherase [Pediococcus pentosaceus]MCG7196386.1 N-acetylmuramic acid 6-phosphate etherase [Pediococcus pentosaceus]MCI2396058.1 N-acetylmuramic acid 6-phosphate etherase [Pediococcus pentosaceus]MCS8564383.1 N-acetylmuramic acid 6-phosphate etherase [Pediococcus pentosaceus]